MKGDQVPVSKEEYEQAKNTRAAARATMEQHEQENRERLLAAIENTLFEHQDLPGCAKMVDAVLSILYPSRRPTFEMRGVKLLRVERGEKE
jgi:hypothetical protein